MTTSRQLAEQLCAILALDHPPVAVSFHSRHVEEGEPEPAPAGCCFWVPAEERTIVTHRADHAGCSVGSYVHGLLSLDDACSAEDVAALVASAWVTPTDLAGAPTLGWAPSSIVYQPLAEAEYADVVLFRVSPRALMALQGAAPEVALVAKPQCQILPRAAADEIVVSPGCAVSRVRTGLPEGELTVALPGNRLENIVARLQDSARADDAVARYAAAALGQPARAMS